MIRTVETIFSKFCFVIQEGGHMMSMAQIQVGWALRDIIKTTKITKTKPKFDGIQYAQCVVHDRHIVNGQIPSRCGLKNGGNKMGC